MPRKTPERPPRWTVRRDGTGKLRIFDGEGNDVFRHPDPLIAAQAVYLAGAALEQHRVLVQMTRRMKRAMECGFGDHRDRNLLIDAECAISDAIPDLAEFGREQRGLSQKEMDFEQ